MPEQLDPIEILLVEDNAGEEDVLRSYKLCANCYITKPVDFEQFIKIVRSIEDFWFTVVTLCPK